MRRLLVTVVLAAAAALAASGQTPLTVAGLQAVAKEGNLDLQKAGRAVVDARKDLRWESELANAKASLSGSVAVSGQPPAGQFSGQAQVAVPVIPQVSLGASVTSEGRASASLSLSPFAPWRASYREKAAWRKAEATLAYQSAKIAFDVQGAAYGVLQATSSLELAHAKLALETAQEGVARQAYEIGELSYDELAKARSELLSARQGVLDAGKGLLNARVQLYRLLGPAAGEAEVAPVTSGELLAAIQSRGAEVKAKRVGAQTVSLTLRQAEINLDSLREQLAATPLYRPSLGLSGQVAYNPGAATPISGSASVSYSFSPSEIKFEDRAAISRSIAEATRDIELERLALRLQASVLDQALAAAEGVLEARTAELAQAETTLAEVRLLAEQGQRTSLEAEESRIAAESARARLLQAAASVLDAQAAILLSYVL